MSAIAAKSSMEPLSEPARIALAVGGSTERKNRFITSELLELPVCNLSRSDLAFCKNCDGVRDPKD